jgi:glycosyltransferase involved in cell wall biosynthesis
MNILLITGDPIGAKMAGPAIRAWNIAEQLSKAHNVRLVTTQKASISSSIFEIQQISHSNKGSITSSLRWADAVIFQGLALTQFPELAVTEKILIADAYDPMNLEQLEQGKSVPFREWEVRVDQATAVLNHQFSRADFVLCASERQRNFYLGHLSSLGRLNPKTYLQDKSYRRLIDVVPFGLSPEEPQQHFSPLKNEFPGIDKDDKVLIWGGGIYDWFDPEILISAVASVVLRHPEVKLYFLGTQHPNSDIPEMGIVSKCRALAEQLGISGKNVFFNENWVEYQDRANYLLDSDAGVSTHLGHIETAFSFRTRILDYLWAGLPLVVSDGDEFAELINTHGLGVTVPIGDQRLLEQALEKVLFDDEFSRLCHQNILEFREAFYWEHAVTPLAKFLSRPARAADLVEKNSGKGRKLIRTPQFQRNWLEKISYRSQTAAEIFSNEGLRALVFKLFRRK